MTKSKELVFYSWIPLSPEVSRLSPFTHTYNIISELQEPSTHSRYTNQTPNNHPLIGGESDVPWKEENKFWIVSSRLRPCSNFSKHSRKSRTVHCEPDPGRSPHARTSDLQKKKISESYKYSKTIQNNSK